MAASTPRTVVVVYLTLRETGAPVTDVSAPAAVSDADATGSGRRRRRVAPVVVTLGAVSLLTDISSESFSAILPLYLTASLGLSTVAYGFMDALYQGVSALVRMAGGWAADRSDRPKWVAFAGYAISCVARIGLLLGAGLGVITAAITADRIGKGLRTAPRDAMISAASDPAHVARAFGVHRSMDTAGAVLGPVLAFAILWKVPDGYHLVLVASFGAALLGLALLGLLVPDQRRAARPARPTARGGFSWRAVSTPGLVRLLVVAGLLGLFTVGDGFLYLALLDRGGFATEWFPLLYVGTNIGYLMLAIPLGRLADRIGRAKVLVGGHVALLAAYVWAAGPAGPLAAVLGTLFLLGVFYAATDGIIAALAGRLVAPEVRASGIAAAQTVVAIARMLSSAGFGLLWFAVGPGSALTLVAVLLAGTVVLAAIRLAPLDRRAEAAA
jgi:MFS family permease